MKFSQGFMDEIRARVRVSEIVGRSIPLRRAGREYHALCPFHKEKTPSFTINDEKGFYHCFGCGAHGDVIGFTMQYEHLSYPQAVERLAGVAGLSMPVKSHAEVEREQKSQSLQQVMEAVTGWFQEQLENTSEGELARRYLHERGLSAETLAKFRLGYAPENRDALTRAMKERGITEAQLIETGMLISVEGRSPYARFRRRLMFPIRDRKSHVIAFGGRVLPGEPNSDAPKYLNSPETPLFHKGRQLFNLDLARRAAFNERQLIICEGYMDVIALAQAGIAHAVAPLGTAITEEQLQLCWHMADAPTVCLDGDKAGLRAMGRLIDMTLPLLTPRKTLRFLFLPEKQDPDSMIRSQGVAAFHEKLAIAEPLHAVLWSAWSRAKDTPEAVADQKKELEKTINLIRDPTVRAAYRQYISDAAYKARQKLFESRKLNRKDSVTETAVPVVRLINTLKLDPAGEDAATNLIALVIACPSLLAGAQAEEFWLHAPMPAAWQQSLHHTMTELHIASPDLTSAELWQAIAEASPKEAIAAIEKAFEGLSIRLDADMIAREGLAQRLWGEVVNDVDRARLKAECVAAEAAFAAELTEENFARLTHLKAQLESLERERSRYYREDPLGEVG